MDEEFEIKDIEQYKSSRDKGFSHSELIMTTLRKCIENGSKEMREGYWNEKLDKFGNKVKTYIEDQRFVYINSVETAETHMCCDFDTDIIDKIKTIKENLKKTKETLLNQEKEFWKSLNFRKRLEFNKNQIIERTGYFNKSFPPYQDYIKECVVAARLIERELVKLSHRKEFYKEEEFEA